MKNAIFAEKAGPDSPSFANAMDLRQSRLRGRLRRGGNTGEVGAIGILLPSPLAKRRRALVSKELT